MAEAIISSTPSWRTRLSVVFFAGAACFVAYLLGLYATSRMTSAANPHPVAKHLLSPVAAGVDFGEVWEAEAFEWKLPIENRGPNRIQVTRVAASCDCASALPQQFSLGPGERTDIRLVLDLRAKPTDRLTDGRHRFKVLVMPVIADEGGKELDTPRWVVSGTVRSVLGIPTEIPLGTSSVFARPTFRISVPIEPFQPLHTIRASVDRPDLSAEARSDPNRPGRFIVDLTTKADRTFDIGDLRANLRLTSIAVSGDSLPDKVVALTGRVVPDVRADPPEVLAPSRPVGGRFEEEVSLSSLTSTDFQVVKVCTEGACVTVESIPGGSPRYWVRLASNSAGEKRGAVRFNVRARGQEFEIVVSVFGKFVE